MSRPGANFPLPDLASQAEAVQAHLAGRPVAEKVAWIASRGRLSPLGVRFAAGRQVYRFESYVGLGCTFFFADDDLVFVGENTLWSVPRRASTPRGPAPRGALAAGALARIRGWLARGRGG
jgi:hypothetical protein